MARHCSAAGHGVLQHGEEHRVVRVLCDGRAVELPHATALAVASAKGFRGEQVQLGEGGEIRRCA